MNSVTTLVPAALRHLSDGEKSLEVRGGNLAEAIGDIATRKPRLARALMTDGNLAPYVRMYLDGVDVATLEGLDTPLGSAGQLSIVATVAGG